MFKNARFLLCRGTKPDTGEMGKNIHPWRPQKPILRSFHSNINFPLNIAFSNSIAARCPCQQTIPITLLKKNAIFSREPITHCCQSWIRGHLVHNLQRAGLQPLKVVFQRISLMNVGTQRFGRFQWSNMSEHFTFKKNKRNWQYRVLGFR